MRRKAKPKNARLVIPRVCQFCRSYAVKGPYPHPAGWFCDREGECYILREFGPDGLDACRCTCDRFEVSPITRWNLDE